MSDTACGELWGRRALVTGASRGTGAAIVARLRAACAQVLATARTAPQDGPRDGFVAADATTPEGVATIVARVRERFGVLDVLVHTLGGSHAPAGGFAALTDEHWQAELALNLLPAVRLDRALLPEMRQTRRVRWYTWRRSSGACRCSTPRWATRRPRPRSPPTARAWPTNWRSTASGST